MKHTITLSILALSFLWIPLAHANDGADEREWHVSVGTDLAPWFLEGFSGMAFVEPGGSIPIRLGVEAWSFRFPDALVELSAENAGEDWERRVDLGLVLYADYHFTPSWHAGVIVSGLRSTVRRAGFEGEEGSFWSGEVLARGGYRWLPMGERGLYIDPWFAIGPLAALEETPTIGSERFVESPVQILATVHAGWRF